MKAVIEKGIFYVSLLAENSTHTVEQEQLNGEYDALIKGSAEQTRNDWRRWPFRRRFHPSLVHAKWVIDDEAPGSVRLTSYHLSALAGKFDWVARGILATR